MLFRSQDKKYHKIREEGDQIILNYIEQRRKSKDKGSDILELILTTPFRGTEEYMSDEKVKVEILQLLVAGNETSTTAATWIFYLLSKYPECVEKIRNEVETTFGDSEVDYNRLHSLSYTMAVLDEITRIYPPFWMIDREAQEDDEFNGIKIAKGTTVIPYIYGVHHNAEVWKDPEKFNPSRFDENNIKQIHPFAHIPFGGGPRVCIGQNMAKMQILLVMSAIIRNYNFELAEKKEIGLHAMMLLKPDGPVNMRFTRITKNK